MAGSRPSFRRRSRPLLNASILTSQAPAPSQIGAEPRPCLIVNPKSFRAASGGLAARAVALAVAYGADVVQADRPSQLEPALDRILARGQRQVFVLAGDGTVQAIVDRLARLPGSVALPRLLILGGGRSNLIAADLGGSGAVLDKLESALARCRDGGAFEVEERHTLSIEQAPAPSRQGFFVAAGAIDSGVRACHRHRDSGRGPLRKGHLSTAWYVLKLALLTLLGRSPIACPDLDIDAADCGRLRGLNRVLIATTLLHRTGLFNPYANRGLGTLCVTAVARRAPHFWRSLPRLVLGRFSERMNLEHGYLSGRCDRIEVLGLSGYALDGETFDTDPARPVVIRSGPRLRFLRP